MRILQPSFIIRKIHHHRLNNTIERRIEILELHDLLLEDLCEGEEMRPNQKVYHVELLDDLQEINNIEEEKDQELKTEDKNCNEIEGGTLSKQDSDKNLKEIKRSKGMSQAGAFSKSQSDRNE